MEASGTGLKDVLDQIQLRKKRLQALVDIAEKSILSDENGKKPPAEVGSSFPMTYVWIALAWIIGGMIILYYIRVQYGGTIGGVSGLSMGLYSILALGFALMGVFYYLSRNKKVETFDLGEREKAAKKLIKEFYTPLENALENDDLEGLLSLADRLLEDPLLASAVEVTREGDPKVAAYALYLYVSYRRGKVPIEEVTTSLETVDNKPLRLLLETLLGEDKT
ncbi:hypothetical protein [Thermococcus waiotapuensis]|uniref:Uncharacterized protein n=1 Tax=Thermococcus waiotapuensis TaxID=90909 RepID=A0AAE4NUJ4_9EURY|nr:hypothetical protein [Thermococcus waiotapuensis]MDV3104623.1 hypothetical protein [Thermococcus waiotapuensis]